MPNFLRELWTAMRSWPIYVGLAVLAVAAFVGAGLRGYRLLGDDNESTETELSGPARSGGHGHYMRFNHK